MMPNGPWINGSQGEAVGPVPLFTTQDPEYMNTKLAHDRYEVFVNGDYAGHKVLLGQSEDVAHELDTFLASRGFKDYHVRVEGDDCLIWFDDADQAERAVENLHVYLHIR